MNTDAILLRILTLSTVDKTIDEINTKDLEKPLLATTGIKVKVSTHIPVNKVLIRARKISKNQTVNIGDFLRSWHFLGDNNVFDRDIVLPQRKKKATQSDINEIPGVVMNSEVSTFDPVIEREAKIEEAVTALLKRKKGSILFVGEPGVGKTAIVRGLVSKVVDGLIPKLKDYTFIECEGTLFKNLAMNPMALPRLIRVLNITSTRKIILFFDEFHKLCNEERAISQHISVVDILKPYLAEGTLQVIGATTNKEAKKFVFHDGALMRRLHKIQVDEQAPKEIAEILNIVISIYEEFHQCRIKDQDAVVPYIIEMGRRYLKDNSDPDRTISIIDECLSSVSAGKVISDDATGNNLEIEILTLISKGKYKEAKVLLSERTKPKTPEKYSSTVTIKDFKRVIARMGNVPVDLLDRSDHQRIKDMEKKINNTIIGQERAVNAFINAIRKFKTGITDPNRPISIFLAGSTGTGKTMLCKTAADVLFDGKKEAFIRIDMSEYSRGFKTSSLIGSPPGYVDSDKGGQLTEAVYKNPHSLILLDEIEKAHDDVLNILLQLMDEGRLTDAMGKTVDFRNCIIAMTSNEGMDEVFRARKNIGFGGNVFDKLGEFELDEKSIFDGLKERFKPEFLNRIDVKVVFDYLTIPQIKLILDKEIEYALARVPDIKVAIKDETKETIIDKYYDKEYGARSIKRGVEDLIMSPLAVLLLENKDLEKAEI